MLALAGSLSLLPLWQNLLHIWLSDPLRSIGFSFPFFALAGIISAWRRCGRPLDGRPWALLLIALSIPLSRIVVESTLLLGSWFGLLHPGPVLFLYAAGAILLFAGPRLLRAAASPLCLLLCIDPVPRFFNGLVDLPLQRFSADVARSFSHLIGLHPTGDQLRMMFAPHFGMMIVPGCNGVRGSVTLFYLCLIFGYSRRLRPAACAAIALCGFVLGYALNLLRLCGLVLYYRIGVTWPVLQKHGTGLDYIIGCIIFLAATLALGVLIRLMEPTSLAPPAAAPLPRASTRKTTVSALLFTALTLAFIIPALRSVTAAPILPPSEATVLASFPSAVGPYHLVGTRSEFDPNGQFTLALADYAPDAPAAAHITLGIWIGSGNHFVAKSKFLQGILPQFTGSFDASAPGPLPVHLVTSLYDDGIAATYDAETACSPTACSDYMALAGRRGIILFPSLADLALQPRGTRLPILLRREWPSTTAPDSAHQRALFESDAHTFISHLDLHHLLQQDGTLP